MTPIVARVLVYCTPSGVGGILSHLSCPTPQGVTYILPVVPRAGLSPLSPYGVLSSLQLPRVTRVGVQYYPFSL